MTESNAMNTPSERRPPSGDERPAAHLAEPIAVLDLPAELARLRDEEPWRKSGRHTRTLIKDADLRAGARLEEHHAPGRITIHALDGRLRVGVTGQAIDLAAGQLVTIGPAIRHDVEALDESAFLLTIAWPA
jgi:mannose-6-phosphate isomerase-like protein (cupin superfamily)